MDEGFGGREGQFDGTERVEKKTLLSSADWTGNREGQFGSSNSPIPNSVLSEPWGDREAQR